MSKRDKLRELIESKENAINKLTKEIVELTKEDMLLCDKQQWYTEETREYVISKRPKKTEHRLYGWIHWNEDFKDDDTGNVITIERSEVVRINGVWQ